MFGRKARRIVELETANAQLKHCLNEWQDIWSKDQKEVVGLRNQIEYLVRTIREMDDQIFSMSQCMNFLQMQPNLRTLCDGMTARKVAESNCIADVLRPQLIDTYRPINAPKKTPTT